MPRCPNCNKFVSVELADPEEQDLDASFDDKDKSQGSVSLEVRLVKTCADCGEELEEATLNLEEDFTLTHDEGCPDDAKAEATATLDSTDRQEGKRRSAKTYYGVDAQVSVTCSGCEAKAEVKMEGEEQASAFESLN